MTEPQLTSYVRLDGREVRAVIDYLGERIDRYLPRHPGLRGVTAELGQVVGDLLDRTRAAARQRRVLSWVSRVIIVVVVAAALVAIAGAVQDAVTRAGELRTIDWLPIVESGINDLVFAGIAIWFLLSLADRVVRGVLLTYLHRLRSMAHIIDMHQMGKDPAVLLPDRHPTSADSLAAGAGADGASPAAGAALSPRLMSRRDYALYLDYCSELLSLTSKAAALCAEESTDSLVLDTVSEIETLTTGMSRKIWQKISLLHDVADRPRA